MTTTMKLIGKVDVGSGGASSISFSSIPGTYTDLVLQLSARCNASEANPWFTCTVSFNGSTSNRSDRELFGTGSSATSASTSTMKVWGTGSNATANTFGSAEIYIPNYAGSTNKSASLTNVTETNGTTALIMAAAMLWSVTDAITSITITPDSSASFVQYTSCQLYGISKA